MSMNTVKFAWILFFVLLGQASAYQKPSYGPGQVRLDHGQEEQEFIDIGITDKTGESVDIDGLVFSDESGKQSPLSAFMREGRPSVLAIVYYECPSLCGLLMNGVVGALRRLDWTIGQEYDVIFVSMDHDEGADLATWKKETYVDDYGKPEAAENWHFLTGTEDQIKALAAQVGFGFRYMPETNEYAHSAGFFVLSDKGLISRTLYGVEFDPRDVRLALLEASQGRIGDVMDKVMLYCFRFDPNSKGYALHALNIVKAAGALTLIVLALYLFIFWRRQLSTSVAKKD